MLYQTELIPQKRTLNYRDRKFVVVKYVLPIPLYKKVLTFTTNTHQLFLYTKSIIQCSKISSGPWIRTKTSKYCLQVMSLAFYHYTNPQYLKVNDFRLASWTVCILTPFTLTRDSYVFRYLHRHGTSLFRLCSLRPFSYSQGNLKKLGRVCWEP